MKAGRKSRKILVLPSSRWGAYATASAATAVAAVSVAEGHIHYSGTVDLVFQRTKTGKFPLEGGANLVFFRSATFFYNSNFFGLSGAAVSSGFQASQSRFGYVSRLRAGENVSAGYFVPAKFYDYIGWGYSEGPWTRPGSGYIAFKFNNGAGVQYGWARIRTRGAYGNIFIVKDYAWGDPGDVILTGQTSDAMESAQVPDEGSLGALALGAIGLDSWRRRRARLRA